LLFPGEVAFDIVFDDDDDDDVVVVPEKDPEAIDVVTDRCFLFHPPFISTKRTFAACVCLVGVNEGDINARLCVMQETSNRRTNPIAA